jgi:hypothetical protein
VTGTLKAEGRALEVVTVAVDIDAVCRDPHTVMCRLSDELEVCSHDRLIILPPLLANVMALPALSRSASLAKAVRRASRSRWGRRCAVRFTYPHARRRRRPWLVMHDEVHAALRRHIGGLAEATRSSVVGGTVLLSHPRTHWEAWPDHGDLFHTSWSFGSDGEPYDVVRQPRCSITALSDAEIDGNDELEVRALRTSVADVCPVWGSGVPAAPIAWLPEVLQAGDASGEVEGLLDRVSGAQIAVRSALSGRLGRPLFGGATLALIGPEGRAETRHAPAPTESRPATWVSATITLPAGYVAEEPTGAP